jgi:hypothetical protein
MEKDPLFSMRGTYSPRVFAIATVAAAIPAFAVAYDLVSAPLLAAGLLVWSLLPVAFAWLLFGAQRRAAAWGWLIAIAIFGMYVWASVAFLGHGSTGVLSFFWIPVWSLILVGPIGACAGMILGRIFKSRR